CTKSARARYFRVSPAASTATSPPPTSAPRPKSRPRWLRSDKFEREAHMFSLTGRKALITGASGGIGEANARILHAQGATVGLHGTRVEKLEALAGELGERVKLFPANLADRDEVKALGQKAEADLEGVDILVNNAGITKDGLFVRMSDADWDAVLEVNLTAVFRLARELTHPMMKRRHGRIINIT